MMILLINAWLPLCDQVAMINFARIQFMRSRTKRAFESAAEAGELKQLLSLTQAGAWITKV